MANNLPKSVKGYIERAEGSLNEYEAPIRSEIDELSTSIPELEARNIKAAEKPTDIEAAWRRGKDFSASEHSIALSEVTKAEAMLTGAKVRLAAAKKRLSAGDSDTAQALVPAFEAMLPGVPVIATHAAKKHWSDIPANLYPAVVLVQTTPTERNDRTDSLSADVEVYYLRSALHAPIPVRALERVFTESNAYVEIRTNSPFSGEGQDGVDTLKVKVRAVYGQALPSLTSIDGAAVKQIGQGIGQQLVAWAKQANSGMVMGNRWERQPNGVMVYVAPGLTTFVYAPKLSEKGNNGTRTVELSQAIGLKPSVEFAPCESALDRIVSDYEGTIIPGVGMVAKVTATYGMANHGIVPCTISMTIQSAIAESDAAA